MPSIIRVILKIFGFYILLNSLQGCKEKACFNNIHAELDNNKIKILKSKQVLIQEQNSDLSISSYFKNKSNYIIDSVNCKIYINVFNQKLKSYDLIANRVLDSITLENMKYSFDFSLKLTHDLIIIKSNKDLLIFDKELRLKQNILDSIFNTDSRLKSQVQGFWDYQIVNDSIVVKLKVVKDSSVTDLEEKRYAFPLY